MAGLAPSAVVLVATIRALKYNGGVAKADLSQENVEALKKGLPNLEKHIENMKKFGVPVVVAINRFGTDTDAEIAVLSEAMEKNGVAFSLCEHFAKGGEGAMDLAEKVVAACEEPSDFHPIYELDRPVEEKIRNHRREIYGAAGVEYSAPQRRPSRTHCPGQGRPSHLRQRPSTPCRTTRSC